MKFHIVERFRPIEIHRHLRSVYGKDATDISSVICWAHYFESGEKDTRDRPNSSQPVAAVIMKTKDKVGV